MTSVISDARHPRAVVGYKISKRDQDLRCGLPLSSSGKRPKFYLGLSFRLEPDDARKYMAVTASVMLLSLDEQLEQVLFHYDYERNKIDGYPEAHLQVCASSEAWERAGTRLDGRNRLLERLHLPVGPRRFRPSVEDIIEFLVAEQLVSPRDGWEREIETGRERFRVKQLRAAIRRDPETALAFMREEKLLEHGER
ncbi:hypothetical protein [Amycolatopsis thermoflava]|uniref:hypothetical protein n=1 Tax=Amycolatopsis thermoflava TaxID=84480 RepID=UPI001ADFB2CF|nr:hypothetical protein [Amycolatopsis thermoflava]